MESAYTLRDLVRNNPIAAQAVQVLVNNLVGPGIRPRAASTDPKVNKAADELWTRWAAECDAHGHTDFYGLQNLAVREMIEGGEVLAMRHPRRASEGLSVPLQVQVLEADHLDSARVGASPAGGRTALGIDYDAAGRRAGYWLFPNHPGDQLPGLARQLQSVRIGAAEIAHLFERQRVQNRGTPWGVPAMRAIRDVDDWQRAELVRKKTEACLVGIVFGADEADQSIAPIVQDSAGNRVEQFEPGLIAYARGGKDIKFNQPSGTAGVYEWHRVQLHIIAAGFRVPYALMTGDLSQTNFSSSRVGLNEFRRMIDQLQWQTIIPMFCAPVWRWFITMAQSMGKLPAGIDIPADWAPPRFESVNPLQDVQADLLEVRAGFSSLPQQIARRGYDPEALIVEWADFAAKTDALNLLFDSDPRKLSKAGLAQMTASDGTPPDPAQNT